MDDLPESSGSWYDDLEMDPDPHEEEVIGTPDPTDFWVNGVAQTIISISGIIGMSQPRYYNSLVRFSSKNLCMLYFKIIFCHS